MDRQQVISYLGSDWTRMESALNGALKSDIPLMEQTNKSILSHMGKMLRPMLALLVGRMCKDSSKGMDECINVAAASEILHNATLLHDDVADQSDYRRGEKTTRYSLGPTASVLIGDFWLSSALMLIVGLKCKDAVQVNFSRTLSYLAQGEILQMEKASSADTTLDEYLNIIYCKTASLFESVAESAAQSVEACKQSVEAVTSYAKALGMAFQIKDDILDYVGDEKLGKPVGIDIHEQKITLPLLGALKNSPREPEIRKMILDIPSHPEYCSQIREFVLKNGGIEYASNKLDEYIQSACDSLSIFPASKEKELLTELSLYNAYRTI